MKEAGTQVAGDEPLEVGERSPCLKSTTGEGPQEGGTGRRVEQVKVVVLTLHDEPGMVGCLWADG